MRTSIVRINLFFLFLFIASCTTQSPQNCVEGVLQVSVTRIDDKNRRFFIVGKNVSAEDIADNLQQLNECFLTTDWKNTWVLSLFSEEKFAGYKSEEEIIPYLKNGSWIKAYQAEYDREKNSLISYPAYNPQHVSLKTR